MATWQRSNRSLNSRLLRGIAAPTAIFAAVAGAVVLGVTPAWAAPGDAAATGATAAIDLQLGTIIDDEIQAEVSSVATSLPGEEENSAADVALIDLPYAAFTLGTADAGAISAEAGARAEAEVTDASITFLGENVASFERATAAVACVPGQTAEGDRAVEGVEVFGVAGPLPSGDDYTASVILGDAVQVGPDPSDTADLSGLTLSAAFTQYNLTSETGADEVGLIVELSLDGTFEGQVFDDTVVANLDLASASCGYILPGFSVNSVSPSSGPVTGGQRVTITGTGFVAPMSIEFGGVAATDVVIDPSGTSLTATSPAGAAPGEVLLTIERLDDGSGSARPYTYVAVAAAVPSPAGSTAPPPPPASRPQLAESGGQLGGAPAIAAVGLAAGVLMVLAAKTRARRRA